MGGPMPDFLCPACRAVLSRAPVQWTVLPCLACGGVWADKEATARVAGAVDRDLIDIAQSTAKKCSGEHPSVDPNGQRACPICGVLMASIRHARVALEVCAEHGTWFDRDELGRMARNSDFERRSRQDMNSGVRPESMRPPVGSSADIVEDLLADT
jgi:Zn-finger nucleic acid-binding protein